MDGTNPVQKLTRWIRTTHGWIRSWITNTVEASKCVTRLCVYSSDSNEFSRIQDLKSIDFRVITQVEIIGEYLNGNRCATNCMSLYQNFGVESSKMVFLLSSILVDGASSFSAGALV